MDKLLSFNDFHNIRYTFVSNLFEYYKQNSNEFQEHLKGLKSWFIWNIYKQLSSEILDKASDLKYQEIEQNFKTQIMEKLTDHILKKIHSENCNNE